MRPTHRCILFLRTFLGTIRIGCFSFLRFHFFFVIVVIIIVFSNIVIIMLLFVIIILFFVILIIIVIILVVAVVMILGRKFLGWCVFLFFFPEIRKIVIVVVHVSHRFFHSFVFLFFHSFSFLFFFFHCYTISSPFIVVHLVVHGESESAARCAVASTAPNARLCLGGLV